MEGTAYVIDQLGEALKRSHEAVAALRQEIAELRAALPPVTEVPERGH